MSNQGNSRRARLSPRRAFTLIELLIVVAIIAILAAIAVPNFLEAQVRAKVSRTRSDCRTVLVAIEAYCADNGKYPVPECQPYQVRGGLYSAAQFVPGGLHRVTGGGFTAGVSSPIAYLTNSDLKDPFAVGQFDDLHNRIFYQNIPYWYNPGVLYAEAGNSNDLTAIDPQENIYSDAYGAYKIGSLGPNKDYDGGRNQYDPTTGTISYGDIYRSQKRPEGGGI